MAEMVEVVQATGPFTPDGKRRAQAALDRRTDPDTIDIKAAIAEFDALMTANG